MYWKRESEYIHFFFKIFLSVLISLSMSSESDNQIKRDREEVEEFTKRLLKRDADQVRRMTSGGQQRDGNMSGNPPEMQSSDQVMELREYSRQVYLEKRQKKEMELLQTEIHDEEMVFSDSELTEAELRERNRKRVSQLLCWFNT